MSEWLQLALALIASTTISGGVVAGIGWWFKTRLEDRRAARKRRQAEWDAMVARVETLQAKVESLLMDAIAREQESNRQMAERIEMDARQNEVITAATTALKESAVALARLERHP